MISPLLEVGGLHKHYPVGGGATLHAVDAVDLMIGHGECVGLVGEFRLRQIDASHACWRGCSIRRRAAYCWTARISLPIRRHAS